VRDPRAYFRRIGLAPPARADLPALRQVVLAHATHIPFENLDAWRGWPVSLEPDHVERKLVDEGRGGWCFEQNLLLGEALRAIGFEVTDLAARVVWRRPPGLIPARTHRLLAVRVDGATHLADVGFGGLTLTGVPRLEEGEQETPHESCRLVREGEDWILQVRVGGEWDPLYRFDLHPQLAVDFEAANFQLAHDPASLFTQVLMAARATPDGRLTLRDLDFTFHGRDGTTRRRRLASETELFEVLEREFGLRVRELPAVAARVARLAATAATG
jgi:N-hydroxyarylamine O-acetyltransferase